MLEITGETDFLEEMLKLDHARHMAVPLGNAQSLKLELNNTNCRFFKVNCLTYEKDFPRQEAFENVVASINNIDCRLAYYLRGRHGAVEFYIGVIKTGDDSLTPGDYGNMLERAFKGNFLGSRLDEVHEAEFREITAQLGSKNMEYSALLGVPSRNSEREDISFQGVDRLVNIMTNGNQFLGGSFHLLVLWEPVRGELINDFEDAVKRIYSHLSSHGRRTVQTGRQTSVQEGSSTQHGKSETETQSDSVNVSRTEGKSGSDAKTEGKNESKSETNGTSSGTSSQKSNSHTTQGGTSESATHTVGKSESGTTGFAHSDSKATTTTESEATNRSKATTVTEGESREEQNKTVLDLMKYIEEELLPRIRRGKAKGMYKTAVYVGAETPLDKTLLENAMISICQGDKPVFQPLRAVPLERGEAGANLVSSFNIRNYIKTDASWLYLDSRPVIGRKISLATWLTASEISMLAGMPQKEVPGLELRAQVSFGLNIKDAPKTDRIDLGHMRQEGSSLKERKVWLKREDLTRHVFIAGTTGSGKTTTCHKLLSSSSSSDAPLPFMVIEPAKTEYRTLLKDPRLKDIIIFTVGNEKGVPFRFNPFEFLPEESLSGHVDLLKASFMASFDMEAAIPNLLEEGLYRVYEAYGWNFRDESNRFLEDRREAWKSGGRYFPTISSYIDTLIGIVDEKGFGERLRDEYRGSIRARLESLTGGAKGLMLDTPLSVDFMEMIDRNVIIELEDLKSGEDKAFLMGLVLGRISEALKIRHREDPSFRHVLLLEEAHRLLSRPIPGDSPNRKLGVEAFTDLLAEVRKYGESLIIVDQIPSKLAPEVLKNTSTKIIHKLFAMDDKNIVGDTMALDDRQKNYLSNMENGEAVIFSQDWKKPVNVKIEKLPDIDTNGPEIGLDQVVAAGRDWWGKHPQLFCPGLKPGQLGWQELDGLARQRDIFMRRMSKGGDWVQEYHKLKELAGNVEEILLSIFAHTADADMRARIYQEAWNVLKHFENPEPNNWPKATELLMRVKV